MRSFSARNNFLFILLLLILVANLLLLEIIVGQLFEFQGPRERFVELLERQFS